MDYKQLLEHSYEVESGMGECRPRTRLEYLGDHIFDFTTYDSGMSEQFALKAVEVCAAINEGKTFDYIKDPEDYRWYLLMVNMPFFANKLEWGTSIRGAWWCPMEGDKIELRSCGLLDGENQICEPVKFTIEEWKKFIAAVVEFAAVEVERVT